MDAHSEPVTGLGTAALSPRAELSEFLRSRRAQWAPGALVPVSPVGYRGCSMMSLIATGSSQWGAIYETGISALIAL